MSEIQTPQAGDHNERAYPMEAILAFALGTLVLVGPVAIDPSRTRYEFAFLSLIGDAVEGLKLYSLPLLVMLGFSLGMFCRSPKILLAFAAVAVFPLWSAVDMVVGGGKGHNLLPLEWMIYGVYGLLVLAGAAVGRFLR